uniref:Aminopeptidase n=1 Tax=Saccoglossus kowalevskii TaxID=10224 RepID=A0ABM0GIF9_SACKO|nr:PREDICTED: aminopeptidase N-like [Saccoglossus kowalevskii]
MVKLHDNTTFTLCVNSKAVKPSRHRSGYYITARTICCLSVILLVLFAGVACLFYFAPHVASSGQECVQVSRFKETNCTIPKPVEPKDPPPEKRDPFEGRLPNSLKPNHYTIKLKVYLDEEDKEDRFTYEGEVSVVVHCFEPTNIIKIHSRELSLQQSDTQVIDTEGNTMTITNQSDDTLYEFFIIELSSNLAAGKDYLVRLVFTAPLTNDGYGIYRTSYNDPEPRWLIASQYQPSGARQAYPCFDEPNFKATFDMIIIHRDTRNALTSMPVSNIIAHGVDNWVESHFQTSVVMSTYLMAIYRVWAQPSLIHATNYSLETGNAMLAYYEKYYGVPYPLPKLDSVAVPGTGGGMENWGLVIYGESEMTYDEMVHSPSRKQSVASITAHEVVHMWFGNLVTMDWWDHLWLNEGFATFTANIGVDFVEPGLTIVSTYTTWRNSCSMIRVKMGISYNMVRNEIYACSGTSLLRDSAAAFRVDSRSSTSRPIIVETGWNDEVKGMFDGITYTKGSAIVQHMKCFLSDEVIDSGISDYFRTYAYGNVVSDDLWMTLTKADVGHKNTNVKKVMDTWTLQAGHPVVTVNRTGPDTAVATQQYFMMDPHDFYDAKYNHMGYTWYVPLTYTFGNDPDFDKPEQAWLNKDEPGVLNLSNVGENDWLLVNVNKWGFYRVNYDDDNWGRLANQLKHDYTVIPIRSRTSIMDDAFKISQPGHTDHVNALRLTEYMDKEFEYVPWDSVIGNIEFTRSMLMRTAEYGMFEIYWRHQITPVYESLGWDFSQGTDLDYFNRVNAIDTACLYGNKDCVEQALVQFRDWMNTGDNAIRDEVRPTVYCTAIKHGGVEEWEFAYTQVIEGSLGLIEIKRLQNAMGCTRMSWLLQRYLEDDAFDTITVISEIRDKSSIGYSVAWDYTMNNFDSLGMGVSDLDDTDYDYEQLKVFGAKHADMPPAFAGGFYGAMQKVETNMAWMDRNKNRIKQWLLDVTINAL